MPKQVTPKGIKGIHGEPIHITTLDSIPGYEVIDSKGFVWASSVRAKNILVDLYAMLKVIWGGEVTPYWELLHEARWDIFQKLNKTAKELDANGIVGLRLVTSQIVPGTLEILAYGSAVKLAPKKK